jgi:exodeoxyribonuclease-3
LVDVFRRVNPDLRDQYTWWSYRGWARERNVGWRLDYFWISPEMLDYVDDMQHQIDVKWSDHCPIKIIFK